MKRPLAATIVILTLMAFATIGFAAEKQITGEVKAVDTAAKTITVVKKDMEVVITVDDKTTITINKEKKALSDVKAGDTVTVAYVEKEGKKIAKSITAAPTKKVEPKSEAPGY